MELNILGLNILGLSSRERNEERGVFCLKMKPPVCLFFNFVCFYFDFDLLFNVYVIL